MKRIPRCKVNPKCKVVKVTWVFKLRRLPDRSPLKNKARFCVREARQTEGV